MINKKLKVGNVPPLRFPGFEGEWKTKKLGEVSSVSSGGTPSRANPLYWNGDIPWISTTLIDFNFIEKSEEYITQEGLENSSAKLFPIGTLLMAMYGQGKTRGKVAILNIEATTNQACGAIITNKEVVNPFFAFQNLVKRYDEIRDLSNQGSQENLSGGIIKRIEITFPKLLEQIKIASFLSLIDERIQTQNKIIERLETLIKGLCQKLILNQVPNKKINNCVSCYSSSLTESDIIDKNGIYPVYGATGVIAFTENSQINEDAILIIKDGSGVGKVQYASDKFSVIGTLNYLTVKPDVNLKYIFFCLKFFNFEKYKVGSGIPHIYFKDYGEAFIYCPSVEEQIKIERLLSSIDEKIKTEKTLLQKYEIKKSHLLQNLFI
ncbi:restriction endonuclease subunit S [Elizabethkingia sp. 2-6]|nr:restriction endonuclease subunit S [Elizabethkingia sp. 2-6]